MEQVRVIHVGSHAGRSAGYEESIPVETAAQLILDGAVVPATVPEAAKAGVDKDTAATKR